MLKKEDGILLLLEDVLLFKGGCPPFEGGWSGGYPPFCLPNPGLFQSSVAQHAKTSQKGISGSGRSIGSKKYLRVSFVLFGINLDHYRLSLAF